MKPPTFPNRYQLFLYKDMLGLILITYAYLAMGLRKKEGFFLSLFIRVFSLQNYYRGNTSSEVL